VYLLQESKEIKDEMKTIKKKRGGGGEAKGNQVGNREKGRKMRR